MEREGKRIVSVYYSIAKSRSVAVFIVRISLRSYAFMPKRSSMSQSRVFVNREPQCVRIDWRHRVCCVPSFVHDLQNIYFLF